MDEIENNCVRSMRNHAYLTTPSENEEQHYVI